MISFLVCSINPDLATALRENLAATAGVEHELLVHDNRATHRGLSRVYNDLAGRAAFPLLCFVHEDVRFRSPPGWGRELAAFFASHPGAGVVGFAGSQVKSRIPSGWHGLPAHTRQHVLQHDRRGRVRAIDRNPAGEPYSRVAVVDGLCLLARREVWRVHRFDEVAFPGFHFYDLDFCTQVAQSRANYVCHTVWPEHFSAGSFGEAWRIAAEAYHRKWSERLPIHCGSLTPAELERCEAYSAYRSLRELLRDPGAGIGRLAQARADYRAHARPGYDLRLVPHRLRFAWRRLRAPWR